MKKSNYNFFYKIEDGILAYNARTNTMAVVEKEKNEELKKIFAGEESEDTKFINELMYGGFLIEDYVDELQGIRHDMYAARFSNNELALTIAPTSDCNFRCPYCYEKDVLHLQSMTDETADKLVRFVEEKAGSIGRLDVTWYGGEPLLEYQRVRELSERFMKICEEHEVLYNAGIVTNGYLLTEERLKNLIKHKVTSIQITLDGTKETHDSRRYLKNHSGTFDKIISNLLSFEELAKSEKKFPHLSVRMNVDRANEKEVFELLDFINKSPLRSYVVPYVAAVYDEKDTEHINILTDSEYGKLKGEFLKKFEEKGFQVDYQAYYPQRITSNCGCDRMDAMVVDAHGNLYKCWEEIGNQKACIGQIGVDETYNLPKRYYDYFLFDPTLQEECKKCDILPVCMGGGCPIRRERDNRKECGYQRELFENGIRNSAEKFGKKIIKKLAI